MTPEAQAIIDKAKADAAKKGGAKAIPLKGDVPKGTGKNIYVGQPFSNANFFGELGDTLGVMASGATAGAGPYLLEKATGLPMRQKVEDAKARLGPVDATAADIFGGVVPAVVGPGLPTLAANTAGTAGRLARPALAALEGAGYGATAAATSLDPNASVTRGALLGGAGGLAGGTLGEGVDVGRRLLAGPDPLEELAQAAAKSPRAAQNIADLGDEGMLGDVLGEPGKAIIRKVSDKSPEARQILLGATQPRQDRQTQNIIAAVEDAAQIAPDHRLTARQLKTEARDYYRPGIDREYQAATAAGKKLEREQRVQSRFVQDEPGTAMLEEGARNITPPSGSVVDELVDTETPAFFGDLLDKPVGREAWAYAKKKLANMTATHGEGVGGDFWMLNEAQKYIRRRANATFKEAQKSGDFSESEIYGPFATSFAQRMEGLLDLPQYAKAKKLHIEMKEDLSAIDRGEALAKDKYSPTLTREAIAAREGPRGGLLGAAQAQGYGHKAVERLLGNRTPGQDIKQFASTLNQEGARAALGDRADLIEEAVRRADVFGDTHKAIAGGSQTSRNTWEITKDIIQSMTIPGMSVGAMVSGDPTALKAGAIAATGWLINKGYSKYQAAKMAKAMPEVARLLIGKEVPQVAPRAGPTMLGKIGASSGKLLGAI